LEGVNDKSAFIQKEAEVAFLYGVFLTLQCAVFLCTPQEMPTYGKTFDCEQLIAENKAFADNKCSLIFL
jgi:hypothetical protein